MPVYEPQEDSELLRAIVEREATGNVLDMGTGSGILAFAAAQKPDVVSVLAIDIDDDALAHATAALRAEKPDIARKLELRKSDLFNGILDDELFDTIICNPPYLPNEEGDDHPALYGGPEGWEYIARFLDGAKRHLAPGGMILLLFSSLTNKERVEAELKRNGYAWSEVAIAAHFFEQLHVYRVRRHG